MRMIIVTGAAGMIGSNLIRRLNQAGETHILAIDNLTNGTKFSNLASLKIYDYMEKDTFLTLIQKDNYFPKASVCFHQGACSATTEMDGRYLMLNNYEYSKSLYHYCAKYNIQFIYASSAAVYGMDANSPETTQGLSPLNPYGYSKLLFDNYVTLHPVPNQAVGLRYFNVYGPNESHKKEMASVVFHFKHQIKTTGACKLFGQYDGHERGEQKRDFVYVDDIVDINLWMHQHPHVHGIFNCGTGVPTSYNQLASSLISHLNEGNITYIDFPSHLKTRYQSFTKADITKLRKAGYMSPFRAIDEGIKLYLEREQEESPNSCVKQSARQNNEV